MQRQRIGIVVFENIEVLDFCGPFEVFSVTRRSEEMRLSETSPFEVVLIAQNTQPILCTGNMKVLPDFTFETCPTLDMLIIPGGYGTRREMKNPAMIAFVQQQAPQVKVLASVCTGSLILGSAGLLKNLRATTHWCALDLLQQVSPSTQVDSQSHVVHQGKIITSAGISAGIDMALQIVAQQLNETIARNTARHMEYPYPEHNQRRITLPVHTVEA
jgi:transcriptional regulator GlxA family with amidase domain